MRRIGLALVVMLLLVAGGFLLSVTGSQLTGVEDISTVVTALSALVSGAGALLAAAAAWRSTGSPKPTSNRGTHPSALTAADLAQLDSDQAPVRLVGLYALERLAEQNPALQQDIVDVICGYLRMPFTPPAARADVARPTAPDGRDPHGEQEVRLAAQRILTTHLRHETHLGHKVPPPRWWQRRPPEPASRHWPGINLDLTGATLIDFGLTSSRVGDAAFDGAIFTGTARFSEATFTGDARFSRAIFTGDARFSGATFTGDVWFDRATFTGTAGFSGAAFTRTAWFDGVTFTSDARFDRATFTSDARFDRTTFTGTAAFDRVTFTRTAGFDRTTFSGDAWFDWATFTGGVTFNGARRLERVELYGVRVEVEGADMRRMWPPGWRAETGADGWQTLHRAAAPEEKGETVEGGPGPGAGGG
ncbi:pentapeptide repeat-containing protein [Nonomuraea sp. NEAU-A123]|uniref:pentapeptide repeat-containing protein n=1 Tax=Nonomuraea sp. NEAU-A123 TaxID=2839649 RepID=UPI001BE3DB50|nr:pentapeptide repeat-containing protein [Nonomuraea sp. NEAU-A123]MBT2234813.1 pentapeptide repeat-containing protein [Nonomuraea sp. NEAU-A123]